MPNAHFDVQIISRGGGHRGGRSSVASSAYRSGSVVSALAAASLMLGSSVVASASYRSGEALYDQRVEKTFDYRAKEDVIHTEIMTPEYAPVWASDRQMLWNRVEQIEKRKDAQLARDIIAALPRELDRAQQIALVRDFVRTQFVAHGMIADIAIHDHRASDGGQQPHVHIMLTLRDVTPEGFGKKNRSWNDRSLVTGWRGAWEATTNIHLEAAGRSERVSLRSYAEQGIDKLPGEHLGPQAWNMEKKGRETVKGDKKREIEHSNEVRALIDAYNRRQAPRQADAMLDAIQREEGRLDAPLLASAGAEARAAESAWGDGQPPGGTAAGTASPGQPGGTTGKHPGYSEQQLEAMHWASVRQAVRGIMRQSVHSLAEQAERVRRYGRQVLDRTQSLARALLDRIWHEQPHAERGAPRGKDMELAAQMRREQERTRRREDRER